MLLSTKDTNTEFFLQVKLDNNDDDDDDDDDDDGALVLCI